MYWIHPSKKFTKCVPRHCSIMVDGQEIICCKWQWQELAYSLNLCYINSGGKLTTQSSSKTPVHTPNVMQDEASKLQWHPPVKEKLFISCQSHSTMQFNKQTLEHCPIILNGRLPSPLAPAPIPHQFISHRKRHSWTSFRSSYADIWFDAQQSSNVCSSLPGNVYPNIFHNMQRNSYPEKFTLAVHFKTFSKCTLTEKLIFALFKWRVTKPGKCRMHHIVVQVLYLLLDKLKIC